MARRGRPKGRDSAETRIGIINAAREEFTAHGFAGASVATIASKADLAPSAVYHYFGGKVALYEEVFDATNMVVWDVIREAGTQHETLFENVQSVLQLTITMSPEIRRYSDFLALMPMETTLHAEFVHMLEHRNKMQDGLFGTLAEQGLRTGELAGFDEESATEMLRSLLMGWFMESYYRQSSGKASSKGIMQLMQLLRERAAQD